MRVHSRVTACVRAMCDTSWESRESDSEVKENASAGFREEDGPAQIKK